MHKHRHKYRPDILQMSSKLAGPTTAFKAVEPKVDKSESLKTVQKRYDAVLKQLHYMVHDGHCCTRDANRNINSACNDHLDFYRGLLKCWTRTIGVPHLPEIKYSDLASLSHMLNDWRFGRWKRGEEEKSIRREQYLAYLKASDGGADTSFLINPKRQMQFKQLAGEIACVQLIRGIIKSIAVPDKDVDLMAKDHELLDKMLRFIATEFFPREISQAIDDYPELLEVIDDHPELLDDYPEISDDVISLKEKSNWNFLLHIGDAGGQKERISLLLNLIKQRMDAPRHINEAEIGSVTHLFNKITEKAVDANEKLRAVGLSNMYVDASQRYDSGDWTGYRRILNEICDLLLDEWPKA